MLTAATKERVGDTRIPERLEGQIPTVPPHPPKKRRRRRDGKPKVEHEGEEDDIATAWACFIIRRV